MLALTVGTILPVVNSEEEVEREVPQHWFPQGWRARNSKR